MGQHGDITDFLRPHVAIEQVFKKCSKDGVYIRVVVVRDLSPVL